jgi:NTP pyrophosphatase (non-canonical NTP hydrolase)
MEGSTLNKTRLDYLFEITEERDNQNKKWGIQNHTPIEWTAILMEEVGEVSKEALEYHFKKFYPDTGQLQRYEKELIQVAAVALAMLESLQRNEMYKPAIAPVSP